MDLVQLRRVQEDLTNKVSSEAWSISNKHNVWLDPLYFEWERFIATFERLFLDILNKMLNCNH